MENIEYDPSCRSAWLKVKDHVPELRDNLRVRILRPVTREQDAAQELTEDSLQLLVCELAQPTWARNSSCVVKMSSEGSLNRTVT